ncbi:hypothetical protein [Streptomyces mangrovisoli]|uniref:Lipoprotein n=1 Tax=Streptomyces mangrovisoli TaxID=1428628 RepID=A0A1J4P231_9ACTN|nr:hypothetical protein [Streptomyces mangrovisoli]OIJ67533.1 hypothetical protein WN71_013195 [Streptomyces mangrovisoli]
MKSTTVRGMALSIAVGTALTGVAACNSSSGGSGKAADDKAVHRGTTHVSPIAALRSAEHSTDQADSAEVESTTSIGSVMSMTGDGSLAWGDGVTGALTITYTGGTTAETMRKLGSDTMQARYLPDAYYAKMGDVFAQQAGGKHWVRYGYDDLEALAGSSGAYLKDQMQNTTPNQSVKLLLASGDVQKVGTATVRGQDTTHYSGTVDVADLAGKNSDLSAAQLKALKEQLTQAGVSTEQIDIWVNGDDLLVKKTERAEMTAGLMTQTAYYSHYGVKVSVQKPPAGDTVDFTKLVNQGDASSGSGTSAS